MSKNDHAVTEEYIESETALEVRAGIDLDQVVKDRKGQPVSYIGEGEPASLRDLLLLAFDSPQPGEAGSAKKRAYKMGRRIFKAVRYLKLNSKDRTVVIERVEAVIISPLIVGQVAMLIDPDYLESEDGDE